MAFAMTRSTKSKMVKGIRNNQPITSREEIDFMLATLSGILC